MCAAGQLTKFQIDRKQRFFRIDGLHFPHYEKAGEPLTDTIIDGELVTDIDPKTGRVSPAPGVCEGAS